jgi:hypothetical protein
VAKKTDEHNYYTDKHSSHLLEPGIIENTIFPGAFLEEADMHVIKNNNLALTKGKRYVVLVSSGYLAGISKEARELTASKDYVVNTLAKAIILENTGHQLIGNFYLKVNKPHIKTKLFTDREKALKWLREILSKEKVIETDWF